MGFEAKTTRKLRAKLNAEHIRTRAWNGKTLSYIEGWHALSEANRIFGFDAWSRETVELKCISESGPRAQSPNCAYLARVRITVLAGGDTIVREGTGAGYTVAGSLAEAHALAAKEAETDATKRALATFGNPFGLALYDKEQKGVRRPKPKPESPMPQLMQVRDAAGQVTGRYSDNHACSRALSKAIEGAETPEELHKLWHNNNALITVLQKQVRSSDQAHKRGGKTGTGVPEEPTIDIAASYNRRCEAQSEGTRNTASLLGRDTQATDPLSAQVGAEGAAPNPPDTPDIGEPSATARRTATKPQMTTRADPEPTSTKTRESIDKSLLALPAPKRIRAPEHLKLVEQMPCLICQRQPSDAHHLKHAQPRAMASKPGDQWVVPLCRIHHRALHDAGNEADWWETQNMDAIKLAKEIWEGRLA